MATTTVSTNQFHQVQILPDTSTFWNDLAMMGYTNGQFFFPGFPGDDKDIPVTLEKLMTRVHLQNDGFILSMKSSPVHPLFQPEVSEKQTNYCHRKVVINYVDNLSFDTSKELNAHIKSVPILDIIDMMKGKYVPEKVVACLPVRERERGQTFEKINDHNNQAYVDCVAGYALSRLVERDLCPGFPKFYGHFTGIVPELKVDITEDFYHIRNQAWFHRGLGDIFTIETEDNTKISLSDDKTGRQVRKITIMDEEFGFTSEMKSIAEDPDIIRQEWEEIISEKDIFNIFEISSTNRNIDKENEIIIHNQDDEDLEKNSQSGSESEGVHTECSEDDAECSEGDAECSEDGDESGDKEDGDESGDKEDGDESGDKEDGESGDKEDRESGDKEDGDESGEEVDSETEDSVGDGDSSDESGDKEDGDESEYSSEDDSTFYAVLKNVPVQSTIYEDLYGPIDDLIMKGTVKDEEWLAILFQIIFSLAVAQKEYGFIHNDLHTNNVMWSKTDEPYLYYTVNDTKYKIPTYGKVIKIIDYGRSYIRFQGKEYFSDAFHQKGDAAGQYNYPPYFNNTEQVVGPNKSFDLPRLACAMYESMYDSESDEDTPLRNILYEWLIDNRGKNILWNRDGIERFAGFGLYKHIARHCSQAVPEIQLESEVFIRFRTSDFGINGDNKKIYVYKSSIETD